MLIILYRGHNTRNAVMTKLLISLFYICSVTGLIKGDSNILQDTIPATASTYPPFPTDLLPPTLLPKCGCKFDGKFLQPGELIIYNDRCSAGTCYACNHIELNEDPLCWTSSTASPTGCVYRGHFYRPGETIKTWTEDQCIYRLFCKYLNVDKEIQRCVPTTKHISPTTSTPPICKHQGKQYLPGDEMFHGQEGHWCYIAYCDKSGQVKYGDSFYCSQVLTVQVQTTTPDITPPVIKVG